MIDSIIKNIKIAGGYIKGNLFIVLLESKPDNTRTTVTITSGPRIRQQVVQDRVRIKIRVRVRVPIEMQTEAGFSGTDMA